MYISMLPNLGLNKPLELWAKICKYQAQCLNKQNQLPAAQDNWRYVELVQHEASDSTDRCESTDRKTLRTPL